MALDRIGLKLIAPLLKGARVLCLGYPDVTVPVEEVEAMFSTQRLRQCWNGRAHGVTYAVPETTEMMLAAGAKSVDHFDVARSRGVEQIHDLNYPAPWDQDYDLVVNPGTAEHCWNVAQAFWNSWIALARGGHALQVAPVSMVNHGFWNVSPTAIVDFHEANGGVVKYLDVFHPKTQKSVPFDRVRRCMVPPECVMYALVQRERIEPLRYPTQWRYRQP